MRDADYTVSRKLASAGVMCAWRTGGDTDTHRISAAMAAPPGGTAVYDGDFNHYGCSIWATSARGLVVGVRLP